MSEQPEEERNRPAPRAYRADQFAAILWLIGGVVIILQTRDLDYMAEYGPGPGFLPYWLGVGFIILALALFAVATFRTERTAFIEIPTRHAANQLILVLAGVFGLVLLAETIGFIICTGLLFLYLLVFVERQGWKFSLIMAIISPLVLWLIFELALELRLPPGLFALFRR